MRGRSKYVNRIRRRWSHASESCVLCALFLVLLGNEVSDAATFTWSGDSSTNQLWSNGANWAGVAPTSANTTDLIFAGTTNVGTAGTPLNNNIANPFVFNSITFNSGGGAFFLGGNAIAIDAAGTSDSITQSSSSNESIANNISNNGGNATATLTLGGNGTGLVTLSGVISDGNGQRKIAITKTGSSTFVLSGNNTYSSGTIVSAGTLFANNATSSTGTGTVTVNGTGTLSGNGKITGAVNLSASGASINAGGTAGAVGTLATGALTLSSASVFSVDMTSTTADRINVTGAVTITSASLQLNIPLSTVFTNGQQFTLISNDAADAISGTFSNAPAGIDTINGYTWSVSYTGGDGNDFVLTAVPEPSTWFAAVLALGAIGFSQRRHLRDAIQCVVVS